MHRGGRALIKFRDHEFAKLAIEQLDNYRINGKKIRIRPDLKESQALNIKVTGISKDVSWKKLNDEFKKAGKIISTTSWEVKDGFSGGVLYFSPESA